jgi:cell division protein FtsB
MKLALILALAIFSSMSFAQDRCEMRVQKLQERIQDLTSQLRSCQMGNQQSNELDFLRRENARLTDENFRLQQRIDVLEGRGREQFFCSAACVNYSGTIDNRYLMTATAMTQLEADLLAKKEVQKKYSCNYGIQTYKCEAMRTDVQKNFCTAACQDYSGNPDQRYMAGARGRNAAEAEVLAIQEVQKSYSCNYGIKIISCN